MSSVGTAALNYRLAIVTPAGTPTTLFITEWNSLRTDIGKAMDAAAAAVAGAYQPLDADLTAIAGLATTAYGRGALVLTDIAAALTYFGAQPAGSYQPLDSDLTAIAALTTTTFGRSALVWADPAAGRTALGVYSSTQTDSAISTALTPYLLSATAASTYQPLGSYVTYTAQTLTSPQQAQARTNIGAGTGSGSVTSVSLTSTDFAVSGSPVTTSGSITANLNTQAGITAGSYGDASHSLTATVNSKGILTGLSSPAIAIGWSQITSGTPTTLAGYGITDALSSSTTSTQNGSFTQVSLYNATSGFYDRIVNGDSTATAARKLTFNMSDGNRALTMAGDLNVTGSATIIGSNGGDQLYTASGDATAPSSASNLALTLATVNSNTGSWGSATQAPVITLDLKGRATAASNVTITPGWTSITSKPTTLGGYGITDAVSSTAVRVANLVFAGPSSGSSVAPTFRFLALADIPDLSSVYLTPSAAAAAYQPVGSYVRYDAQTLTSGQQAQARSNIGAGTGGGSVTSVALGSTDFTVSGSPVTGSGTITANLNTQAGVTAGSYGGASQSLAATVNSKGVLTGLSSQSIALAWSQITSGTPTTLAGYGITDAVSATTTRAAGSVFAGPTTGTAAPTFRALVAADIPSLPAYQPAGTYATGTGTASGTNTGDETTSTIKTKLGITTLSGSNTGDETTSTIQTKLSAASVAANQVYAGPASGSAAAAAWRALVIADLPSWLRGAVSTTDATVTSVITVAVPATTTLFLEGVVVARRTGGTAGTAEDGASYKIMATVKNVAGSAVLIGTPTPTPSEDVAAYDCAIAVTGANLRVRVTGVAATNINWVFEGKTTIVS